MGDQQKVERVATIRRLYDPRRNPPDSVDEELPTRTVQIFSRRKQGTILSTADGANVIMGSIQFSGSYYELYPGSYSLRIIRRSVYIGSTKQVAELEWKLRHSRLGTVDMIPFYKGSTPTTGRSAEAFGNPMAPLYAFGPGTLWQYINPRRGTARVYASLEGVF